jgi:hypothetical protein
MIGHVTTDISEFSIREGKTRKHDEFVELNAFLIKWISIDDIRYLRKGLGSFLFLYCLIDLINENPLVRWIVLDDDSDKSDNIRTIYDGFGFELQGLTELLDDNKHVKMSGPEKQLNIERHFLPILDHLCGLTKTRINENLQDKSSETIGGFKTHRIKSKKYRKKSKKRSRKNIKKNKKYKK